MLLGAEAAELWRSVRARGATLVENSKLTAKEVLEISEEAATSASALLGARAACAPPACARGGEQLYRGRTWYSCCPSTPREGVEAREGR